MARPKARFKVYDYVKKVTGDYTFPGQVVASFRKRDNATIRYVVEDDRKSLHIFSESQLDFMTMDELTEFVASAAGLPRVDISRRN